MVTTKLVSVFATKFSPEIDAETLHAHLEEKLCRAVTCQRIATVNSRYDSFKISAECKDVGDMHNPELWLEGAFVRRFYEPRKAGFSGANVNAAGLPAGALNAPASGMRAQV